MMSAIMGGNKTLVLRAFSVLFLHIVALRLALRALFLLSDVDNLYPHCQGKKVENRIP